MSWLGLEFEIYDEDNPRPEDRIEPVIEEEVIEEIEEEEFFEYVQTMPIMDFLPMEILIKIFSYLNISDRFYASLVCKRFFDATLHPKFSQNLVLNITESISDYCVPLSYYTFTERFYPIISLSCVNLDYDSEDFWIGYGENIRELYFKNGLLRKEEFVNVLKYTPNLEKIKIEGNTFFKNWTINEYGFERRVKFPYCYHFSLARNNFMAPSVFQYLMFTAENITELDLSNCFHIMSPKERNQVLDYILEFLTEKAKQIKLLNFSNTVTDDLFLTRLSEIDNLKLRELSLTFNGCSKNSTFGFPCLIRAQSSLEALDLTTSNSVNDYILSEIVKHMTQLKKLILKKCHNITDIGVRGIVKLRMLEHVEISNCDHVSDSGIFDGIILGVPRNNMREMHFGLLANLTENVIFRLVYFYSDIKVLDLGGSSFALTDNSLQMILKQMKSLTHLNVDNCCKLSDYGFTGAHSDGKVYHSLKNLKGLKTLRCCGLYKLTDITLESFDHLELKELYFARCGGFTEKGIKNLTEKCPSLEILDLTECKKINDKAIEHISKNLHRLKTLKLNGCMKISEKSMKYILRDCVELRNLHIRNCDIDEDVIDDMTYMRSIRKVYSNLN